MPGAAGRGTLATRPDESAAVLHAFAAANGVALAHCTPREGLEQMLRFHATQPAQGCDVDRDRLLFEWGTCDWGDGANFELDITRQFADMSLESDQEGDDSGNDGYRQPELSQLHLTFKFQPSPQTDALGAGNQWCVDPAHRQTLSDWALATPAMTLLADQHADAIVCEHWLV